MDYNALKVADLKGLLKERGIPSTGLARKQQIIEALEKHDAGGEGTTTAEEAANVADDGEAMDEQVAQEGNGEVADEGEADGNGVAAEVDVAPALEGDSMEVEVKDAGIETTAAEITEVSSQLPLESGNAPSEPPAPEVPTTEPTVLESNQPVSKEPSALTTPRQTSPMAESTSSDRKRKRRSPTPPVDAETVSKKLKAADEDIVTLPEDRPLEEGTLDLVPATTILQSEHIPDPEPDAMDTALDQTDGAADRPQTSDEPTSTTQPSIHPATRAIYISNLVRPIQLGQLSDHLTKLAIAPGDELEHENLERLHLGAIRTHAFAIFNTIAAASRVRSALHGRIWPDEPARKELWIDFVPDEKVQEWIDRETDGSGRRDTRRWEVVYDETDNGVVTRHQEAMGAPAPGGMPDRRPSNISTSGQGLGMPNAPLGPRSSRPSVPTVPSVPAPKQSTPNPTSSASFVVLDERFPSTTVKPKLYYLPVAKDLAERRLEELERQTSREWGARGGEMAAASGGVRRFTFEDGDRLVDGGPHYDDFSGPRRGGGGGGRGMGRGGGFRGRR